VTARARAGRPASRGLDLPGLPRHGHAHRHQAQVAVDADDPVLPAHPFGGVVGDAHDDLQVRRNSTGFGVAAATVKASIASSKSRRPRTGQLNSKVETTAMGRMAISSPGRALPVPATSGRNETRTPGNHHAERSEADFPAESAPQEATPERHLLGGEMGMFGQRGFPISPSR
jgi:hypothetical protein